MCGVPAVRKAERVPSLGSGNVTAALVFLRFTQDTSVLSGAGASVYLQSSWSEDAGFLGKKSAICSLAHVPFRAIPISKPHCKILL